MQTASVPMDMDMNIQCLSVSFFCEPIGELLFCTLHCCLGFEKSINLLHLIMLSMGEIEFKPIN